MILDLLNELARAALWAVLLGWATYRYARPWAPGMTRADATALAHRAVRWALIAVFGLATLMLRVCGAPEWMSAATGTGLACAVFAVGIDQLQPRKRP